MGKKLYKCDIRECEKTFSSKFSLKRHNLRHVNSKKHICQHCQKAFSLPQYLEEHEYTHTGAKPFQCGINGCQENFRQRGKLSIHRKNAHPNRAADDGLNPASLVANVQGGGFDSRLSRRIQMLDEEEEKIQFGKHQMSLPLQMDHRIGFQQQQSQPTPFKSQALISSPEMINTSTPIQHATSQQRYQNEEFLQQRVNGSQIEQIIGEGQQLLAGTQNLMENMHNVHTLQNQQLHSSGVMKDPDFSNSQSVNLPKGIISEQQPADVLNFAPTPTFSSSQYESFKQQEKMSSSDYVPSQFKSNSKFMEGKELIKQQMHPHQHHHNHHHHNHQQQQRSNSFRISQEELLPQQQTDSTNQQLNLQILKQIQQSTKDFSDSNQQQSQLLKRPRPISFEEEMRVQSPYESKRLRTTSGFEQQQQQQQQIDQQQFGSNNSQQELMMRMYQQQPPQAPVSQKQLNPSNNPLLNDKQFQEFYRYYLSQQQQNLATGQFPPSSSTFQNQILDKERRLANNFNIGQQTTTLGKQSLNHKAGQQQNLLGNESSDAEESDDFNGYYDEEDEYGMEDEESLEEDDGTN